MLKRLVLGAVLGGLTVFAWGALSWMALPWHEKTLLRFADEEAVSAAVRTNAPQPGIYALPSHEREGDGQDEAARQRMIEGPTVFAAVRLSGVDPESPALYLKGLLIEIAGALVATLLLLLLPPMEYWGRVRAVTLAALFAAAVAHLPEWHWWGFSASYTLATILGLVIAWFLAGLVIAAVVRPPAGTAAA